MPYPLEPREDPKLALAAELLRRFGNVQMKAWGASMLPSLWPGDLLMIQSAAYDEVVPGDIVLFVREDRFFVHRLIEARRDAERLTWITRGDGMPNNDPPVAASELLGRVTAVSRGNRSFVPSREVPSLNSALAWTLGRWDRLRNLALRIHAIRLQEDLTGAKRFIRSVFSAGHGLPGVSPTRTPHP
jgi:signal peptidase I